MRYQATAVSSASPGTNQTSPGLLSQPVRSQALNTWSDCGGSAGSSADCAATCTSWQARAASVSAGSIRTMGILQGNSTQRRNANDFPAHHRREPGTDRWNHAYVRTDMLFPVMLRELLLLSGRGGGL